MKIETILHLASLTIIIFITFIVKKEHFDSNFVKINDVEKIDEINKTDDDFEEKLLNVATEKPKTNDDFEEKLLNVAKNKLKIEDVENDELLDDNFPIESYLHWLNNYEFPYQVPKKHRENFIKMKNGYFNRYFCGKRKDFYNLHSGLTPIIDTRFTIPSNYAKYQDYVYPYKFRGELTYNQEYSEDPYEVNYFQGRKIEK
jgi:hypothetical protein